MFELFSQRLTSWATTYMLNTYSNKHVLYDLGQDHREGVFRRTVKNIRTGDKFCVTSDFRCTLDPDSACFAGRKCWHQVYTGVLCIHGLLTCVDRINRTKELYDKKQICYTAMKACHPHWYRATYSGSHCEGLQLSDPTGLSREVVVTREMTSRRSSDRNMELIKQQFNHLISICSTQSVTACLRTLQLEAMEPVLLMPSREGDATTYPVATVDCEFRHSESTSSRNRSMSVDHKSVDSCDFNFGHPDSTSSHNEHDDIPTSDLDFDFSKPPEVVDAPTSPLSANSDKTQLYQCAGDASHPSSPSKFTSSPSSSADNNRIYRRSASVHNHRCAWSISPQRKEQVRSSVWISAKRRLFTPPRTADSSDTSRIPTPSSAISYQSTSSGTSCIPPSGTSSGTSSATSSAKSPNLISIDEAQLMSFSNPTRRSKRLSNKRVSVSTKTRTSFPKRRKRRPNRGSTDNCEICKPPRVSRHLKRRRTTVSRKNKVNHKYIHDAAISRVVGPEDCPDMGEFTAKEMRSIVIHLGLTPIPHSNKKVTAYYIDAHTRSSLARVTHVTGVLQAKILLLEKVFPY